MNNSENILWGAIAFCVAVWLVGWLVLDAGMWIHVFVVAAMSLAMLIFTHAFQSHNGGR